MDNKTEKHIQYVLWWYRSQIAAFPMMVPNVFWWRGEADLIYISKSGYVTEYEIKLTRSDFVADRKKLSKHLGLINPFMIPTAWQKGPRHFYYVCPEGVIPKHEIPAYAGLIYVPNKPNWSHLVDIIIDAPKLLSEPLKVDQILELMAKGTRRYWHLVECLYDNNKELPKMKRKK